MAAVEFRVRYALRSYLALTGDRIDEVLEQVGRQEGRALSGFERRAARIGWQLAAPLIWLFKRRRIGHCEFTVDERGLTRRSNRLGSSHLPWSRVRSVQCLPSGWLVHFDRDRIVGIPAGELDAAQRAALQACWPAALLGAPR